MPRLEVRDFGPLAEASVDLKPLTIFFGPNNTGKSYLALAIYSLSRILAGGPTIFRRIPRQPLFTPTQEQMKRATQAMEKVLTARQSKQRRPSGLRELLTPVRELFSVALRAYGDELSLEFANELRRCYGTDVSGLGRRGSSIAQSEFSVALSDFPSGFSWAVRSNQETLQAEQWETRLFQRNVDLISFFEREV